MMAALPKPIGFSDELIRQIAMDIGKEVVFHIEWAYPAMFTAVAADSAKLSIRNSTFNAIMSAMNAADEGRSEQHIAAKEAHRRKMRKMMRRPV